MAGPRGLQGESLPVFSCLRLLLYLHQAGVDVVLRQRLAGTVDLVELVVRPQAHAVPGPLVGEVRRLDARLEAEDREPGLLVVGVRRVLKRARLDEINVLRGILLTAPGLHPLAQLFFGDRLLLPGEDL